jgi:Domain of unknown function (DUF397)
VVTPPPAWHRSAHCGASNTCVEVAPAETGVMVRDSKHPDAPALALHPGRVRRAAERHQGGAVTLADEMARLREDVDRLTEVQVRRILLAVAAAAPDLVVRWAGYEVNREWLYPDPPLPKETR